VRGILVFLLFFLLPSTPPVSAAPPGARKVKEGFRLYREGKYRDALRSFQSAFDAGFRDGRLEYDMGNCWWRLGDKARALVHYERARAWMPRDPDVLANIRLCRKALGVDSSPTVPFLTSLAQALSAFTLGELLALAAAFSVLCSALLALHTVFGKPILAWSAAAAALALLLFGGQALGRVLDGRRYALVTVDEAGLLSEPREGLSPLATLKAGLEVRVLGGEGSWTKVEVEGRKGWLPVKDLGFLDWREEAFREGG